MSSGWTYGAHERQGVHGDCRKQYTILLNFKVCSKGSVYPETATYHDICHKIDPIDDVYRTIGVPRFIKIKRRRVTTVANKVMVHF